MRTGALFNRTAALVLVGGLLIAAGCGSSSSQFDATKKQTVKIGLSNPYTGGNATFGVDIRDGAALALENVKAAGRLKNYDIELLNEDDKGNPTDAVNSVNKLVFNDKVSVVVGHVNSTNTLATMGITQKAQTPHMAPGWNVKITANNNPFMFRVTGSDSIAAKTMVDWLVKNKMTKVAIIYENDDFGRGGLEYFSKELEKVQLKPSDVESYTRGDKDFSGQLLKIAQNKPDAVLIWGIYVETASISQQIRQLFNYPVQILGSSGMAPQPYRQLAGKASEGAIFVIAWTSADTSELNKKFLADYQKKFNRVPSDIVARGYDSMEIISRALDAMGPVDMKDDVAFKKKLRDAIAAVKYQGLQGDFAFDAIGEGLTKCVLVQIKDGKDVVVNQ